MIPQIFPEGKLSKFKGVFNPSIQARFAIYFVSISIFPLFILFNVIFALLIKAGLEEFLLKINIVVLGLFVTSFFITFLIASYFKEPLKELKNATEKIAEGNYDVYVKEVSSDEMGSLIESVNQMAKEIKEKELIKDTFGKMVDPLVRDYLLSGNMSLGGEEQNASILFTDIRNFTGLSEKLKPNEIVDILNIFFESATEIIINNRGLVNKYIGDALLAVYGVPVKIENPSDYAVASAVKIIKSLEELNKEIMRRYDKTISVGIGVHYGNVLAGNIGSKVRMEYTVIGDTVNLASRLESLTKIYKTPIIISAETKNNIKNIEDFTIREIDTTPIKGKEKRVTIYEVIYDDIKREKTSKFLSKYNEALEL
ncbi:MAG TPA: adenylate/guanylate cyclase domain-containing protein, partial [Spirochaetota bacterium]|nr:adenylate/guanylate cyclase domain-containing protein [Spirochaetota bacterium]